MGSKNDRKGGKTATVNKFKKEKKDMKSESFDKTFRANKHCMALHLD